MLALMLGPPAEEGLEEPSIAEEATSFVLTDAWIKGNLAQGGKGATGGVGFGGGLELLNSSLTLARVWIVGNMAIGGPPCREDPLDRQVEEGPIYGVLGTRLIPAGSLMWCSPTTKL